MRRVLLLILLMALPATAIAQVSVSVDRLLLGPQPCVLRSGATAPTGGTPCEFYLNTATGDLWQNVGGTWRDVTSNPVVVTLTANTRVTTPLITTAAADNLTLRPVGDIILDPTGRDILPGSNYYQNIGSPFRKFLTLHAAELDLETLVAIDVISTIGGRVVVAPTTALIEDLNPAATAITTKHNQMVANDIVRMEGNGQVEFMRITSAATGPSGAYVYSVTRNLDGSGANQWLAGDAVLNTGSPGKGFIDLYAVSGMQAGFGPSIVGNVRTGTAFNQWGPRWAIGNLNSIGYGHATDYYGIAGGNPGGAYFYTDDVNGIVLSGPLGTRVQITPSGTALFVGDGSGMTSINGGNIQTRTIVADKIGVGQLTATEIAARTISADRIGAGVITAYEIAANTITTGNLNFVPVQGTNVIASINASAEGGGTLQITGNKISITGATTFQAGYDPSGKIGHSGAAADVNNYTTTINGGKITAGTITTGQLNFAAVTSTNVIASINASGEALVISGSKIQISGLTTFDPGYNPATKITSGNAAADVNANITTIDGGKITANSITANEIVGTTLSAISANLGDITAGNITSVNISAGSISGTTISGVGITGSTISAGNGNVTLDNNGLTLSGSDTGSGAIKIGNIALWGGNTLNITRETSIDGRLFGAGGLTISGGSSSLTGGNIDLNGRTQVNDFLRVTSGAYISGDTTRIDGTPYIDLNGTVHIVGRINLEGPFDWNPPIVVGGNMNHSGGSVGVVGSSRRFKENIRPFMPTNPMAILSVPLVQFDIKAQPAYNIPVQPNLYGMIAEDVYKIVPGIVLLDAQKEPNGINQDGLITHVIAALKATVARVEALEKRVLVLEAAAKVGAKK